MHATPNAPLFLKQSSRVCMRGNQTRDVLWLKMARAGQAGFVFSVRGEIMVTRRHDYVRFQVLKYEETFSARGVGSFGARC